MWCDKKKHGVDNSLHAAIMWVIWLHRNNSVFNHVPWYVMSTTRFYSCRLVGPPSAEVCTSAANFP